MSRITKEEISTPNPKSNPLPNKLNEDKTAGSGTNDASGNLSFQDAIRARRERLGDCAPVDFAVEQLREALNECERSFPFREPIETAIQSITALKNSNASQMAQQGQDEKTAIKRIIETLVLNIQDKRKPMERQQTTQTEAKDGSIDSDPVLYINTLATLYGVKQIETAKPQEEPPRPTPKNVSGASHCTQNSHKISYFDHTL